MQVLVIHGSRFGSTAEVAERMAGVLREAGHAVAVHPAASAPDPFAFDAVVIGSGVYAGHWTDEARAYVRRHDAALAARPVWLFSVGPIGRMASADGVEPKDVPGLRRAIRPRDHRTFFGAWSRSKADDAKTSLAEGFVARHLLPEGDFRDWPAIEAWARGIARELAALPVRVG